MTDPLFTPLVVRELTLRNRLVMSPMTRNLSPDRLPPASAAEYYGRRADQDIGLVVTEGIAIDHPAAIGDSGAGGWDIPELSGDAKPAWRRVVDRVHAGGAAIFPQLWHQGGLRRDYTGRNREAPSPRPSGIWGPDDPGKFFQPAYREAYEPCTRPATDEEIADLVSAYGRSARDAVECGFDGIAIHGAHGYLPDIFFWHRTNLRSDRWGGPSLKERAAFGAAIVKEVREAAGNRPIMFRFSQWKLHDYDARLAETPDELGQLLEPLSDAGVDIFDASTRKFARPEFDGSDLTLAGWAQKLTGKPAMAVGGIGLADDLQSSLGQGSAVADNLPKARSMVERDEIALVGVGRSLLANEDFGTRIRNGDPLRPYDPAAIAA